MYMCLWGTLRFIWRCVFAKVADYFKDMHTDVHPLIFLVVLIPEDRLTYQPLPCNYTRTSFLDYIRLYAVIVFHWESLLVKNTDTSCPTWFITFSTRCNSDNSNVPSEFFPHVNFKIIWYIPLICQHIISCTILKGFN